MDRDRLKDIHQSDLSESRVNEDFVVWLKTKGPFWLLFCLVLIFAFLFWTRYQEGKAVHVRDAWVELGNARIPESLIEVAQQYPDVGAVSDLARLRAAQAYLASVNAMRNFDHTPDNPKILTEKQRTDYLADAKSLFRAIIDQPSTGLDRTLITINAMAGLASIAEIEQDPKKARDLFTEAAQLAQPSYPLLAQRLTVRAEAEVPSELALPEPQEASASPADEETTPLTPVEPTLRDVMSDTNDGS